MSRARARTRARAAGVGAGVGGGRWQADPGLVANEEGDRGFGGQKKATSKSIRANPEEIENS